MTVQMYNIKEAKAHLSKLIQEVDSGIDVIIAKAGKPMARITRIEGSSQKIKFGILKGKINVAEDFDALLPEDLLAEFEGNQCGLKLP